MSDEQAHLTKNGPAQPTYNEPPPAYPGPPQQVFVTGQPATIILQNVLHEDPAQMRCPGCGADIITQIRYENGTVTYLAAGLMCIVGLWLGCCLIPFCINGAKDVVHSCPNCLRMVGRYNRM